MANSKLKKIRAKLYGEEEVLTPSEQKVSDQIRVEQMKVGANLTFIDNTISLTKANVVGALGYTPPAQATVVSNCNCNCDCRNCDCCSSG